MTTSHAFDEATRLAALGDGRYRAHTAPDYANMVGPFGGIVAATVLQAPCIDPGRAGDPSAFTINFCGPIADGTYDIAARRVRDNRSNQHWSIEATQGDAVVVTATAVFATRRPGWTHTEDRSPAVPPAADIARADPTGRPPWTRRYDMRFVRGTMPSLGDAVEGGETISHVWIADDPPRPLDYPSLAAICDAFFPRIFLRRPVWTPVGTVSLTIYFHADAASLAGQGDRPVLGVAWASHFGNGMFDEHAQVWSDDGRLLATAHQIVYYKG